MTPDDRRHATSAGARQHYRDGEKPCEPCRTALRAYQKKAKYDEHRGIARRTPSEPISKHVRHLLASGMTAASIAAASGVSKDTIERTATAARPMVLTDNAVALLCVKADEVREGSVASTGTIRRIQALACLGWSYTNMSTEAHRLNPEWTIHPNSLAHLLCKKRNKVKVPTAQAIRAVFRSLSMRLPEPGVESSIVRTGAARKGWVPPLAWDDIDNDPHPRGTRPTSASRPRDEVDEVRVDRLIARQAVPDSTRAEKVEAMRRWLAAGRSEKSLCEVHGWHDGRYSGDAA